MKFKFSYVSYSVFWIILLSSMTLFLSLMSPIFDLRVVLTSSMYCLLTVCVFSFLTYFANHEKIPEKYVKVPYLIGTFIYTVSYVWASLSFMATQQILRGQSFWFIYRIYPRLTIAAVVLVMFCLIISAIIILNKRIHFEILSHFYTVLFRVLFVVSLLLWIAVVFIVPLFINVFDPIVELHVQSNPIYLSPEKIVSDKVINFTSNLSRPNVLFVVLESVSSERVGAYGYPKDVTPNIDALAKESLLFKNAYATATHTDYAQPSLFSSRYMLNNYFRNLFIDSPERKMVWDVFKEEGYDTSYVSSMDNRWADIDKYFIYDNFDFVSTPITDGYVDHPGGISGSYAGIDFDHNTTNLALEWLDNLRGDNPFFMVVNFEATHLPLVYPDEYKYFLPDDIISMGFFTLNDINNTNNRFDNSLRYVDAQVGRLIEYLNETGKLNNTIIVITPDHGHDFLRRHNIEGHGNSVYNEELKIPLIMYFPDLEGRVIEDEVSQVDITPSLIDIIGFEQNDLFLGTPFTKKNRFFFYAQNHKHFIGMLKDDLKVIADLNKKTVEVFNITSDENELNDLYERRKYDEEILELLMWHTCQKEYFWKGMDNPNLSKYCDNYLIEVTS